MLFELAKNSWNFIKLCFDDLSELQIMYLTHFNELTQTLILMKSLKILSQSESFAFREAFSSTTIME